MGSPLFPHKYAQLKHLRLTSAVFGVKEFASDKFDLFWTGRLVSGVVEISREVLSVQNSEIRQKKRLSDGRWFCLLKGHLLF